MLLWHGGVFLVLALQRLGLGIPHSPRSRPWHLVETSCGSSCNTSLRRSSFACGPAIFGRFFPIVVFVARLACVLVTFLGGGRVELLAILFVGAWGSSMRLSERGHCMYSDLAGHLRLEQQWLVHRTSMTACIGDGQKGSLRSASRGWDWPCSLAPLLGNDLSQTGWSSPGGLVWDLCGTCVDLCAPFGD